MNKAYYGLKVNKVYNTWKKNNTHQLPKTGSEFVFVSENLESLTRAGKYKLEENLFCLAYCLYIFFQINLKETIKLVSS